MSKKRGLSTEEKRTRMLQLFHETKEFFQLKELEKIAPKEKGIVAQSVKDVIQSLVDDGLVDTDKIGTSVYYWSYPSKAKQTKKRKLSELEGKLEEVNKKLKETEKNIKIAQKVREDTEERRNILSQIQELKATSDKLNAELNKHKENNPEVWKKMQQDTQVAKEAANRWTDNIFAVKSWCKDKFNMEGETLDDHFGIPPDLDYLE